MPLGAISPSIASGTRPPLRMGLFFLIVSLAAAGASALHAADGVKPAQNAPPQNQTFGVRDGDQVWLVNTRGVNCPLQSPGWSAARLSAGYWQGTGNTAFYASDDSQTVTVIYIHGNRMDPAGAESRGLAIYRELFANFEGGEKVRFVIWSWPSTQIRGPLRDIRAKAARSDDEAYLLARFLAPIPADRRVGLIGFSYGPRIIGGALHLLGGGRLLGQTVVTRTPARFRVVYWAAGVQNDWLLPRNVHGQALPLGERWLNIYTSCDSVLWRFNCMDRCDRSPAQGYVGLAGKYQLPADLAARYEDWDVAPLIGGEHRSEPYFYQSEIIRRTRDAVLGK